MSEMQESDNGITTIVNKITFKIERRNSPYNKYIKWFRVCFNSEGKQISSIGYKTEREARDFSKRHHLPIGNRIVEYIYKEE